MAQTTTLLQLITRAQQRFDVGQGTYIDNSAGGEWTSLINEALAALHNELMISGEGYTQTETSLSIVQGQVKYALPGDIFKLIGVFLVSSGNYIPMSRFMTKEYQGGSATVPPTPWNAPLRYDIRGTNLWLDPTPNTSTTTSTIAVWYAPQFIPLAANSDTLPAWLPLGWEEFLVNYAVTRARYKEQTVTAADMNLVLDQMRARLTTESINRDMMNSKRVVDRQSREWSGSGWPY